MANEAHLAILKQGVQVWNEWREENYQLIEPDLSGINLTECDLQGAFLDGTNFQKTNLSRANIRNARLNRTVLTETVLIGANLDGTSLSGVDLRSTILTNASLCGACLSGSNLMGLNLRATRLERVNLNGAELSGSNLSELKLYNVDLSAAKLNGTDLRGADLSGANLLSADLTRANLVGANLQGSNLVRASLHQTIIDQTTVLNQKWIFVWTVVNKLYASKDFRGLDLRGVNFSNCELQGVDFSEADLSGAFLERAKFRGANFSRAKLVESYLLEADFSGANLDEADLRRACAINADFSGMEITGGCLTVNENGATLRKADLRKVDFFRAKFFKADLQEANLKRANLREADLERADLTKACLKRANLTRVQAIETNFTGANFTGACLEGWNNNNNAKLDDIECKFVYLKHGSTLGGIVKCTERYPSNSRKFFASGEFSKLFQADCSYSRLAVLDQLISKFENLLDENSEAEESLFHNFLQENYTLLDIYGYVESKPCLAYPSEELSATGKTRLQPDFIIRYPGNRYKLVEIEKPGKRIATKQGHSTSLFTQASWQLGEWEHYIKNYPSLLRDRYPGIATYRSSMLVIGRRLNPAYMELLIENFPHDEIYTYDDLLDKAKQAYQHLKALSI